MEEFIKKYTSLREVERALEMPEKSLKFKDGLPPKKWAEFVEDYLKAEFNYPEGVVEVWEMKRRWGNYKPSYKDGHARFRDVYEVKGDDNIQNNGLWKRFNDWAYIGIFTKEKYKRGEMKIKNGWASTGEIDTDDLGEFVILENGIKVYNFPKPEIKL